MSTSISSTFGRLTSPVVAQPPSCGTPSTATLTLERSLVSVQPTPRETSTTQPDSPVSICKQARTSPRGLPTPVDSARSDVLLTQRKACLSDGSSTAVSVVEQPRSPQSGGHSTPILRSPLLIQEALCPLSDELSSALRIPQCGTPSTKHAPTTSCGAPSIQGSPPSKILLTTTDASSAQVSSSGTASLTSLGPLSTDLPLTPEGSPPSGAPSILDSACELSIQVSPGGIPLSSPPSNNLTLTLEGSPQSGVPCPPCECSSIQVVSLTKRGSSDLPSTPQGSPPSGARSIPGSTCEPSIQVSPPLTPLSSPDSPSTQGSPPSSIPDSPSYGALSAIDQPFTPSPPSADLPLTPQGSPQSAALSLLPNNLVLPLTPSPPSADLPLTPQGSPQKAPTLTYSPSADIQSIPQCGSLSLSPSNEPFTPSPPSDDLPLTPQRSTATVLALPSLPSEIDDT